jgi:predicted P-loop ATPase
MPRVTIDLSEAQSRKPIPEDTYRMKVSDITGPHKGPKSRYMTVVLEIIEGEHTGRKFYHNLMITGKAAGMFAEFLSKLTGQEIDVDELENMDIDTDDYLGMEIGAAVQDAEYEGETKSEIKKFLKAR